MLIPAVSVLAAITLLPALLATLGTRINSVRLLPKRFVDSGHPEDGWWGRWAELVMRRPVPVAVVGLAIVGVLVYSGVQLNPSEAQAKDFPGSGDAIDGRARSADAGIRAGVHEAVRRARRDGASRRRSSRKLAQDTRRRRRGRAAGLAQGRRAASSRRSRRPTARAKRSRTTIKRRPRGARGHRRRRSAASQPRTATSSRRSTRTSRTCSPSSSC